MAPLIETDKSVCELLAAAVELVDRASPLPLVSVFHCQFCVKSALLMVLPEVAATSVESGTVVVTVVQERVPPPLVLSTCPLLPSEEGSE